MQKRCQIVKKRAIQLEALLRMSRAVSREYLISIIIRQSEPPVVRKRSVQRCFKREEDEVSQELNRGLGKKMMMCQKDTRFVNGIRELIEHHERQYLIDNQKNFYTVFYSVLQSANRLLF